MDCTEIIEELKNDLLGRSTVKRRKAAVNLRTKHLDGNYCDLLLEALRLEEGKDRWQTKIEIIKTIGVRKCEKAEEYLETNFIVNSEEHSLISMVCATALVRLKRKGLEDSDVVIELINTGKYSLIEGALETLGYDRMIPSVEKQKIILDKCKNFGLDRPKGYTDPRYGLAASCAKWNLELVEGFLNECIATGDVPLVYVAEKSLQKKYVKLR